MNSTVLNKIYIPERSRGPAGCRGVEIFANLFKAIVDEMAWIVLRSSHTTFVKETQDFGVALVTPGGEMFAYPYGSGATPLMGSRCMPAPVLCALHV